jgi:hypothetical protein
MLVSLVLVHIVLAVDVRQWAYRAFLLSPHRKDSPHLWQQEEYSKMNKYQVVRPPKLQDRYSRHPVAAYIGRRGSVFRSMVNNQQYLDQVFTFKNKFFK